MRKLIIICFCFLFLLTACEQNNERIYHYAGTKIFLTQEDYSLGIIEELTSEEVNEKIREEESFVLFVYKNQCEASYSFKSLLNEFSLENTIRIYALDYSKITADFLLASYSELVPTIMIINSGKVNIQLDPTKDEDLKYYKNKEKFASWFETYVELK